VVLLLWACSAAPGTGLNAVRDRARMDNARTPLPHHSCAGAADKRHALTEALRSCHHPGGRLGERSSSPQQRK